MTSRPAPHDMAWFADGEISVQRKGCDVVRVRPSRQSLYNLMAALAVYLRDESQSSVPVSLFKGEPPKRRLREGGETGPFSWTVGIHPETGHACEFFIEYRGKSGQDLDEILRDLGIQVSKIMQGEV